jgi:hypothetical protein
MRLKSNWKKRSSDEETLYHSGTKKNNFRAPISGPNAPGTTKIAIK